MAPPGQKLTLAPLATENSLGTMTMPPFSASVEVATESTGEEKEPSGSLPNPEIIIETTEMPLMALKAEKEGSLLMFV